MKRYCQTLSLKTILDLLKLMYVSMPTCGGSARGIKEVGIVDMQIYIHENRLFMIVDTVDDFDWERDMNRLATLPRQAEWEAYMDRFQNAGEGKKSNEKWQLMTRIFKLE